MIVSDNGISELRITEFAEKLRIVKLPKNILGSDIYGEKITGVWAVLLDSV